MILNACQKIEVVESTKQTKAGSIGYIIYANDLGPFNLVQYDILFTKFGKKGQARFSLVKLVTNMIDIDSCKPESSRNKLKILLKEYLHGLRTCKADSKLQKMCHGSKNVMELETWDFMAYISSLSLFLCRSLANYNVEARSINLDDVMHTPPAEVPAHLIGSFIGLAFNRDKHERVSLYQSYFETPGNRKHRLEQLYKTMCLSRRPIIHVFDSYRKRNDQMISILLEIAHDNKIRLTIPRGE